MNRMQTPRLIRVRDHTGYSMVSKLARSLLDGMQVPKQEEATVDILMEWTLYPTYDFLGPPKR